MNQTRTAEKRRTLSSENWARSSSLRNVPLFFCAQANKEKNKYVLATLPGALGQISKPSDLHLTPVYALLGDERWLVRHSAIQALQRTSSPEAEDKVLHLLRTTSDPYDLVYCQATLKEIGSTKAIPFITKNLKSRKRDVKDSAQSAIALKILATRSMLALRHHGGRKIRATSQNSRKSPRFGARFPQPRIAGRLTRTDPACRRGGALPGPER